MFDELIRALRKLERGETISVPINSDEEGYFDKECPSESCQFQFKILGEDWKEKVRDEEVFCPNCGHTADAQQWWTSEQAKHVRQVARAHLENQVGKALKRGADGFNRQQSRNSFISMTMKVEGRPQQVPLPPPAADPMKLKITCPTCSCRYAVIGAAYFCPACGHNAANQMFAQTVNGIRQILSALDAVRTAITDPDTANSTVRLIVENSMQLTITAFQRRAEAIFADFPAAPKVRRNAFQNLAEGNQLWQAATGKAYEDHLTARELARLQRAFQQRHLLAHRQGLVDQDYLDRSDDTRYKLNQRVVIQADAVLEAVALVEKLIAGMTADVV